MLFNKTSELDAPQGDSSWNFRVGHKPGEAKLTNLATHIGRLVQVQSHLNDVEEDIQRHQRGRVEYRRAYRQMRALWYGVERREPHWPETLREPGLVDDPDMRNLLARVWTHREPLPLPRVADVLIANALDGGQQEVVAAAYRTVRVSWVCIHHHHLHHHLIIIIMLTGGKNGPTLAFLRVACLLG